MSFFFNKLFTFIFLAAFSLPLYFGYQAFKEYQIAIEENPQRSANIADIIDLKFGKGKYLIEYPSLGGTGYEQMEAEAQSFFDVFAIGEGVTVSFQPEKTLIINQQNYFFWGSLGLIYGSIWLCLLFYLISIKPSKKRDIKVRLMSGLILMGFATLMFSIAHYGWKEKAVYLNYSHQVSGELTDYHQKMCGGRKKKKGRKSTKKYPCFTRIVTYSPLGSFEAFTVKDNSYSRDKEWEIGTPFEVVYLKSNEASSRILDTVESNIWVYVLLFFMVLCFVWSGYIFWGIFKE